MAFRSPPRKVTYFEPARPRLARNTIIESTFEVGRRFHCTMRVDCAQLDSGAVIRPMAPPYARASRRRRACGLARRPQCRLSARCTDNRRAPSGRRCLSRAQTGPALLDAQGHAPTSIPVSTSPAIHPAQMTGGPAPGAMLGADCLWRSARANRTIDGVEPPLFRSRS